MSINDIQAIRKVLFSPCESKEHLDKWLKYFLEVHLPDCIVHEDSNSSPLDFLYECYSRALANDLRDFSRVMAYASRSGSKTLSASVFEVLGLLHLESNVIHMASILEQSEKSLEYIKGFLGKKHIRDFTVSDNKKSTTIVWYKNEKNNEILTEKEFTKLDAPIQVKAQYKKHSQYIKTIAATVRATNGQHSKIFIADEVDIIQDEKAYEEAKNIPMSEGNKLPITILISTRKYSYGNVQREINEAADTGLEVRHWNIIDVTAPCPTELHKPEAPKVDVYISTAELQTISTSDYEMLDDKRRELFQKYNVFAGCEKCRLLPACRTRLATHQKSTSKYLRNIYEVINIFRQNTKSMAKTQLLCEMPDESGLIFPKFNRETHVKSSSEIWELVTGETPLRPPSKADLINLFKQMDFDFVSGMDFGYTHSFAVVSFATDGYRAFVFDAIVRQGLDMDETIEATERVKLWDPVIFADKAYPKDIKTFKRRGFHMKDWEKGPGSVEFGLSIVRMKLKPAIGGAEMFFLGGDPELEGVIKDMAQFHYATDPNHNITDKPDEKGKDTMDALRYGLMNYYAPGGNLKISNRSDRTEGLEVKNIEVVTQTDLEKAQQDYNQKLLQEKILERTGGVRQGNSDGVIKKRGFIWDY